MSQWLIIGISGVTCGGKTTLSKAMHGYFKKNKNSRFGSSNVVIGDSFLINQDNYFLPVDDPRHQWVEPLNHINWEIMSSLDMDRMIADIRSILKDDFILYEKAAVDSIETQTFHTKVNILVLEGFLIFNHPQLLQICQIKFHLHLPYEKCFERRKVRVYEPPDVTGYFEMVVWPMYEKHFREFRDQEDILMLNGDLPKERIFKYALSYVNNFL